MDTSVFGGYFDEEFSEYTIPLFNQLLNRNFILLFFAITQDELKLAPPKVQKLVRNLPADVTESLETTNEVVELAQNYIDEKVVGHTSFTDCLHIAVATINHADYLVSWNFKHVVNVQRIRGYNSINIKRGYKPLEIRSPREFITYENDK